MTNTNPIVAFFYEQRKYKAMHSTKIEGLLPYIYWNMELGDNMPHNVITKHNPTKCSLQLNTKYLEHLCWLGLYPIRASLRDPKTNLQIAGFRGSLKNGSPRN